MQIGDRVRYAEREWVVAQLGTADWQGEGQIRLATSLTPDRGDGPWITATLIERRPAPPGVDPAVRIAAEVLADPTLTERVGRLLAGAAPAAVGETPPPAPDAPQGPPSGLEAPVQDPAALPSTEPTPLGA